MTDREKIAIRRRVYWAWLRAALPTQRAAVNQLLTRFQEPEDIFRAAQSGGLVKLIGGETSALLSAQANDQAVEENWERLQRLKIGVVLREDPLYPPMLKDLYDPPQLLYMRGRPQALLREQRLCVVGTRKPSDYGRSAALSLSRQWAELGGCVVSGMALGIDADAHYGALSSGVNYPTIAVLPGGLEQARPRQNEGLFERLLEEGLLISENPPDYPLRPGNIPHRNRIMAALCQGVFLVEAPHKSGTQYTVSTALDLGREVFALPGQIDSPNAAFPNQLIREGAKIVNDIRDIAEEYPALRDRLKDMAAQDTIAPTPKETKKRTSLSMPSEKVSQAAQGPRPALSAVQQSILDALLDGPANADGLVLRCGLPVFQLLRELSRLQTGGYVRSDALGHYERIP